MNRRTFLRLVTAGAAGLAVAPLLPLAMPAQLPAPGLSMRFIRNYSVDMFNPPQRLDVLYGIGTLRPEYVCRINA